MTNNNETYERVTARIVVALEHGDARPWTKLWSAATGRPQSISTGETYQGINSLVLGFAAVDNGYASPWWATYRQLSEIGAQQGAERRAPRYCSSRTARSPT